jgi:hypothetical protein
MYLRLRQICLVAGDKQQTVADFAEILGIVPVHGSGDLSFYGLPACGPMSEGGRKLLAEQGIENLVFGAGSDFIEVLFPTRDDATAARYRRRRGGDTGYMLILQADDVAHFADLARQENVRIAHAANFAEYVDIHLHTKDAGGTLLSMARHLPENRIDGPWYPAGTAWEAMPKSPKVKKIVAVELQDAAPEILASRWSRLLGLQLIKREQGFALQLDDAELRFVPTCAGEAAGFSGFDLQVADPAAILSAAASRGLTTAQNALFICGLRCRLVG